MQPRARKGFRHCTICKSETPTKNTIPVYEGKMACFNCYKEWRLSRKPKYTRSNYGQVSRILNRMEKEKMKL